MPTWSNTKQILFKLDGSETPVIIYTPSEVVHKDVPVGTRFNGYITDLRVKSKINSLTETPLPEFELGQSKTQKMALIRDIEYFSPHYHADVVIREIDGQWLSIFEFPLHARKPFFITELLGYLTRNPAYAIAPNIELGIGFKDVGYGYPQYNDDIVLYGLAREEYSTPDPPIIIQSVLPANPSEEIDMATLTATNVTLTIGANVTQSTDTFDQFSNGSSCRLLAWESLKLAQLDFTLEMNYPPLESVLLEWPTLYSAGPKRILHTPVITGFDREYQPNVWVEIRGNQLVLNSQYYMYSEEPYLVNSMTGKISGVITFALP